MYPQPSDLPSNYPLLGAQLAKLACIQKCLISWKFSFCNSSSFKRLRQTLKVLILSWPQVHGSEVCQRYSQWARARTSKEVDRTLHTDFAKFKTPWDFLTKISALLQLWKIWFLTKFEGCSSKIVPATPIGSFLRFWREIQILSTYDLHFLSKAGFHRG